VKVPTTQDPRARTLGRYRCQNEVCEATIGMQVVHDRDHKLHGCVRPGCTAGSAIAYCVTAPFRLAGRDWQPGEFVDLCPDHDWQLRMAVIDLPDFPPSGTGPRLSVAVLYRDGDRDPLAAFREWPMLDRPDPGQVLADALGGPVSTGGPLTTSSTRSCRPSRRSGCTTRRG